MRLRTVTTAGIILGLVACAGCNRGSGAAPQEPEVAAPIAEPPTPVVRVVFLGDSITAGYGLGEDQAFPALIAAELSRRGIAARIVNAGVSGDTTAGGVRRLDWLLRQQPDIVVVGLGGNDALRGLPLSEVEQNLREIVTRSIDAGARVLLAGMKVPPNYGVDYATGFEQIYPRLADAPGVALMPFLLDGVAAEPGLNLPDGIHPNAEGQQLLARNVLSHLEPLLDPENQ